MTARSETFYRYAGEIAQDLDTAVVTTLDAAPPACSRDESAEMEAFASAEEMSAIIRVLRSGLKSIHVSGISGDVGRDAVLLSLARVLAETGRRILVVDADADGPPLAEPGSPGLTDVMAGSSSLAEAIIPSPGYEGMMAFLPIGTQLPALEAPGAADPMSRALAEVRPAYDVTLVSAPCLDRRGKVHPAASACEGVLLVLSPTVVSRDRIRRNFLQLWGVEAPIRGLITLGVPDVMAEVLSQGEARTELETLPKPTNLSLARGGSAAVSAGSLHAAGNVGSSDGAASTVEEDTRGTGGGADDGADDALEDGPGIDLEWASADDEDTGDAGVAGANTVPEPEEIELDASDVDVEDEEFVYAHTGNGDDDADADYDDDAHDSFDEPRFEAASDGGGDGGAFDEGGGDGDGSRGRLVMFAAAAAVALAAAAWLWPNLSGGGDDRSGSLAAYEGSDNIPDEVVLTESSVGAGSTAVNAGVAAGTAGERDPKLPEGARGAAPPAGNDSRWESAAAELTKDPDPTGRSWIEPRDGADGAGKAGDKAVADRSADAAPPAKTAETTREPVTTAREKTPQTAPTPSAPTSTAKATSDGPPATAALIDAKSGTIRSSQFDGRASFYAVHITSFRKRASAAADAERLSRLTGHPTEVVECYLQGSGSKSGTWYRVLVGEFSDRDAATVAKSTFIDEGITDWCRVYNVTSR